MSLRLFRYGVWAAIAVLSLLLAGAYLAPRQMDLGEPVKLGAAFSLVDQDGKPITEKAFEGHPTVLFFGFTHCPEVCPTTLYELSGMLDTLGDEGKDLRVFFVSVDPERDTPEIMKGYVTAFGDRITGITGSQAEVDKLLKGWRVYAKKVPLEGDDYTMDHTASTFLVDRDGRFKGTIDYEESAETAVQKLKRLAAS